MILRLIRHLTLEAQSQALPVLTRGPPLLNIQSDIASSFSKFQGVDVVMYYVGLILAVLGFMAWNLNKKHQPRRAWGKRLFGIGIAFILIGQNFSWFFSLVNYVLNT
ncbi:hypothetical protein AV929_15820 [Haloarcula sp. K1]|nr:hypothetical protein AV929_15820 [Haloarcula sp. K1]